MTRRDKIQLAQSQNRGALNALIDVDASERTDEQAATLATLMAEARRLETDLQAAIIASPDEKHTTETVDAETAERLALRNRSTFGAFVLAALSGRLPGGSEAEFSAAFGAQPGSCPMDLWEADRPEVIKAAATAAPATGTGTTVAPVQPFVFAPSIASRLGIDMPSVGTGGYSEMTISTKLPAAPKAKGVDATDTAGALTAQNAGPRRVSARMTVTLEDVAAIGAANFESALRQNVSMSLSDAIDNQIINGDGNSPNISGLLSQLTAIAAGSAVATFDDFVALVSDRVDGLWATGTPDVAVVVNPETYRLSAKTFRGTAANGGPVVTASAFLKDTSAAFFTNNRMPVKASHVAATIAHRQGRPGLRTACLPTWGTISIDDIYTDSRSGQRHFTVHSMIGDKVLITQPAAYVEAGVRISS